MRHCPNDRCPLAYRPVAADAGARCPECGTPLLASGEPPDPRAPAPSDRRVSVTRTVGRFPTEMAARAAGAWLEAHDIPVRLAGVRGAARGFAAEVFGEVELKVAEEDLAEARALLAEREGEDDAGPEPPSAARARLRRSPMVAVLAALVASILALPLTLPLGAGGPTLFFLAAVGLALLWSLTGGRACGHCGARVAAEDDHCPRCRTPLLNRGG